jgi:spermidine/putrescine-binding protein
MKKRLTAIMAVVMLATFLTAGCGGTGTASNGEVLYVYNWSEYMPQEVYDLFEEETGIEVRESTFSSNEEMLAKLIAGGTGQYDIIVASNYVLQDMIGRNLIQPIDKSSLENFKYLDESCIGREFDPDNTYSIPYMTTMTVVAVNRDWIDELGVDITCMNDLADPRLEWSMVTVDDCREITGVALLAQGEDPNTTDKEKIAGCEQWMKQFNENVKLYDSDTAYAALATNEVALGLVYNIDAALAIDENDAIDVIYLDEGYQYSIDSFTISSTSKHVEAAQQFIDFIMRPDVYKMCLEEFPGICLNKGTYELLDEDYLSNAAADIPASELERGHLIEAVGDAASDYDAAYSRMKN